MTAQEQKTVQKISNDQIVMKERQHAMQSDIDGLKELIKKIDGKMDSQDAKLDTLTSTLDNLSGGKQALMWVTGVVLTLAALGIAFFNVTKDK
jgi:tetrahydromethanopterin S-methyltransferase subunit B